MIRVMQANRAIAVHTPLGEDELVLTGYTGREAMSQPFKFELDLLAANETDIPFEDLLGRPMTIEVTLPSGKRRFINGVVSRMSESDRDDEFTQYWAELVPQFWLLSKKVRSRIFQQMSTIQILQDVLQGTEIEFLIQTSYRPRNYCVQYEESDFDFANRLMEEEGIFYYFQHTADGHVMVISDHASGCAKLPDHHQLIFDEVDGGVRPEDRITDWERFQELRSSKVSLWDHQFAMPRQHLEAERSITPEVAVGSEVGRLKLLAGRKLEVHAFPGEYAKRFDDVGPGGADRPTDLTNLVDDKDRIARIRMEQETVPALTIRASGTCRHLVCGHTFELERHHNANGAYLLTSVNHTVRLSGNFRAGMGDHAEILVDFTCIPIGVPFRPTRRTARPLIHGTQTAHVVGPKGEEIFTDKYGRVKVQFHWDRYGLSNPDSSCWVRVAQIWAGSRWGASFWPRIGQEVVVAFENGDPDAPIIVGSVYNAEQMPPYLGDGPDERHKVDNRVSGIKTCSTPGGNGFNELRFDDKSGHEQVFLHAQRQKDERVGGDSLEDVGNDRHLIVHGNQLEHVLANKNLMVDGDHFQFISGDDAQTYDANLDVVVGGSKMETVDGDVGFHCYGHVFETIDSFKHVVVGDSLEQNVKGRFTVQAGRSMHFRTPKKIVLESDTCVTLKVGGSYVEVTPEGVDIFGPEIWLNCGAADVADGAGCGAGPAADAQEADPAAPRAADGAKTGYPSALDAVIRPKAEPNKKGTEKKGKGGQKPHQAPGSADDEGEWVTPVAGWEITSLCGVPNRRATQPNPSLRRAGCDEVGLTLRSQSHATGNHPRRPASMHARQPTVPARANQ